MKRLLRADVDAREVGGLRFILATAAFLGYFELADSAATLALASYTVYAALCLLPAFIKYPKLRYCTVWIDVVWSCLLIWLTGPSMTVLSLFYVFSIVVAAFSYGFEEARRITIVSVVAYAALVLVSTWNTQIPWDRLFLRCSFLLVIGFLIAHWGGAEKSLKEALSLLSEVSRMSNPRFGVDLSTITVLRKIKEHFEGDLCMAVSFQNETLSYQFRQVGAIVEQVNQAPLPVELKPLLMDFEDESVILYYTTIFGKPKAKTMVTPKRWAAKPPPHYERVASFLEARSFISVPLPAFREPGRLFLAAEKGRYTHREAIMLQQIAEQAFTILQQLELVDRLASDAAREERKRIVGDLHDSTIQPYIGLKMGLDALCRRASTDNPLYDQLMAISKITSDVIGDLRSYVAELKNGERAMADSLHGALQRQAEKFAAYYGIRAQVEVEDNLVLADRLTVEVLQMIAEGLSNVHKHTDQMHAVVRIVLNAQKLLIEIENETTGTPGVSFQPGSISRRAESLGGTATVRTENNKTSVRITIPT